MAETIFLQLNRNRKLAALLFAGLSAGVCVSLCFILTGDTVIPICMTILTVHIVLSAVLWFKGIASAMKWAAFYLYVILGISVGLIASLLMKSSDADGTKNGAFCSVLAFILFFRIPFKIQERIEAKLGIEKKLKPERERKGVPANYEQLAEYRGVAGYSSRPYALGNVSPMRQKIRWIAGGLFFIAGFTGLVLSDGAENEFGILLKPSPFWLPVISLGCMLMAASLVFFGFLRSLAVPPGYAGVIAIGYCIYHGILRLMSISLPAAVVVLIILLALAFLLFCFLLRKMVTRTYNSLVNFERGDRLVGIDLTLQDIGPVRGYSTLTTVRIDLQTFYTRDISAVLDRFNNRFLQFCAFWKLFFCGFELDAKLGIYTLYIYQAKDRDKKIRRFVSRTFTNIQTEQTADKRWKLYRKRLVPNRYEKGWIQNRRVEQALERSGFDFLTEVPQVFEFGFKDKADAEAFVQESAYEFDRSLLIEEEADEAYSYKVYIQITGKVGFDRLNLTTNNFIDWAARFHGELTDWIMGELIDEA